MILQSSVFIRGDILVPRPLDFGRGDRNFVPRALEIKLLFVVRIGSIFIPSRTDDDIIY